VFLDRNGWEFGAPEAMLMLSLASGELSEQDLAAWFERRIGHQPRT
jgi:prophage maintenance system killer protein